ncbi:zf-HC2 domain-containing protein [Actinomadura sp. 6N118]|uniref:zf-HC2 domain-containing protein n=1 Tax=Actinomadura sp. 6N118 TaxID=3375151 RepID=UPI0037A66657
MPEHTDVAAYSLGVLSEDARSAFEAHLPGCPRCSIDLARLTGAAGWLLEHAEATTGEEPDPVPAERADVVGLLHRRGADLRARRHRHGRLAAVASALLFAVGGALGTAAAGPDGETPGDLAGWGQTRSASDGRTGAAAMVALSGKGWGTHVAAELGNLRGPATCQLIAVGRDGTESVVAGWSVPASGYGPLGSHRHLQVRGGTALTRADIAYLVVRSSGGDELVRIPA